MIDLKRAGSTVAAALLAGGLLAGCSGMSPPPLWRGLGEPVALPRPVGPGGDMMRMRDAGAMPGETAEPYRAVAEDYVRSARVLNAYQIEAGQVMLARSGNRHVRSYAERMIGRHTMLAERLEQAAAEAGVAAPAAASPGNAELIRQLQASADPDVTYLGQQRGAAFLERRTHLGYMRLGEERALRRHANRARGQAEREIRQLDRLERRVLL